MCHKTVKKTCIARLSLNRISPVWYNTDVALLIPGNGKEVQPVDNNTLSFIYSILASVVAHYICKWFDEWR